MSAAGGLLGVLALAWERPLALALLALALPLVLAHLARRRRERLVVPQVALLVEARGAAAGAGLGARVREPLALAARLLALGSLVVVAAGLPQAGAPAGRALVLVLDGDATTLAREADGRSRQQQALQAAAEEVRAHAAGPVSVVVAAPSAWVLAQDVAPEAREGLAQRLEQARDLERLRPTGPAPLEPAVALARGLAGDAGRVLVLSARALPEGVEVRGVGRADDDMGFVDLDLAPGGEEVRVTLGVQALGARAARRRLVLEADAGWREVRDVVLESDERTGVSVRVPVPPQGGLLRARLEALPGGTADAFARNDALEVVLPARARPSVLAVHDGRGLSPWTAAALAALGERIDTQRSGAVAASGLAGAPARDVVLVDGAPLPPGTLRPGAYVFLAPSGGELPFALAAALDRPLLWRDLPGHPLALDLDLPAATVLQARPLLPAPGMVGVAFAGSDQPVLAEGEREGVRYVALALDPAASDLPVRAAFPLLVRNAILRLWRARSEALPAFVQAGQPLRARLPLPGGEAVRVAWAGRAAEVPARVTLDEGPPAPWDALGVARLRPAGDVRDEVLRAAVVDLTPWRIAPVRVPGPVSEAVVPTPAAGPGWSRGLLLLALLLLALDLALGRAWGGAHARAGEGSGRSGVALSPLRASLAPWKTESSAKP